MRIIMLLIGSGIITWTAYCQQEPKQALVPSPAIQTTDDDVPKVTSEKTMSFIKVHINADQAARQIEAVPVVGRTYDCPTADLPPASSPIASAYEWLKLQPDFAGWVDA